MLSLAVPAVLLAVAALAAPPDRTVHPVLLPETPPSSESSPSAPRGQGGAPEGQETRPPIRVWTSHGEVILVPSEAWTSAEVGLSCSDPSTFDLGPAAPGDILRFPLDRGTACVVTLSYVRPDGSGATVQAPALPWSRP